MEDGEDKVDNNQNVGTVVVGGVEEAQTEPTAEDTDTDTINWTGSSFIENHKSKNWYALLTLVGIVVSAVVYLWTRDIISTIIVSLSFLVFGFYSSRKPTNISYSVSHVGVQVGTKGYNYNLFRSFVVVDHDHRNSVALMPLKRFMLPVDLYFEPKDEDKVINLLALYLPNETHDRDMVDRLMKRVRF